MKKHFNLEKMKPLVSICGGIIAMLVKIMNCNRLKSFFTKERRKYLILKEEVPTLLCKVFWGLGIGIVTFVILYVFLTCLVWLEGKCKKEEVKS